MPTKTTMAQIKKTKRLTPAQKKHAAKEEKRRMRMKQMIPMITMQKPIIIAAMRRKMKLMATK